MINYKFSSYLIVLALIIISTGFIFAQQAGANAGPTTEDTKILAEHLVLGAGVIIVFMALFALLHLVNMMMKVQQIQILQEHGVEAMEKVGFKAATEPWWKKLYRKATNVVPLEKEEDILFDHSYDGIRELDNSLPPWWVAMFYMTIAFAVVYFGYYHIFDYGKTQAEEYTYEMEQAQEAVKAYLATQAESIDETNVVAVLGQSELGLGKVLYDNNCAVCHGQAGEGGVGPNFADAYWIHGGDIKDIFKTIKYGVPEKGMIAWKSQLKPSDMQKVASYILSFQGTNPPNAKAPQGELYQQLDSAQPATDSTGAGEKISMQVQ